jgi:hypothetical protein
MIFFNKTSRISPKWLISVPVKSKVKYRLRVTAMLFHILQRESYKNVHVFTLQYFRISHGAIFTPIL